MTKEGSKTTAEEAGHPSIEVPLGGAAPDQTPASEPLDARGTNPPPGHTAQPPAKRQKWHPAPPGKGLFLSMPLQRPFSSRILMFKKSV